MVDDGQVDARLTARLKRDLNDETRASTGQPGIIPDGQIDAHVRSETVGG